MWFVLFSKYGKGKSIVLFPCVGRNPTVSSWDSVTCVLCSSHRTLDFWCFWPPQMCARVHLPMPHHTKAILCHTVWVFHNLAQFWRHLSRDSVRFHRFGAQSQETAPILPLLPGFPQLLSSLAAIRGSDPFLGLTISLEQLTELKETYSLACQFIKGYDKRIQMNSQVKRSSTYLAVHKYPSSGRSWSITAGVLSLQSWGCITVLVWVYFPT